MRRTWTRRAAPSGSRRFSPPTARPRRSRRPRRRPLRLRRPSGALPSDMSVWAILVAAGRGERLGLDRPKAFAKFGDEPLLAEPLRRLEACPRVDGIVL